MDPGAFVGGTFMLGMFGTWTFFIWARHKERVMQMKSIRGEPLEENSGQVKALREELARLRETSTQYDISIQHMLEEMQERLSRLEHRTYTPQESTSTSQKIGRE